VSELWRALDDRAHVDDGDRRLQQLPRLDARRGVSDSETTARRRALLTQRHVAPSILSADFARLGSQVSAVLEAGARVIHVDVMDGHFVPQISFGAIVVSAIADLVHDAGGFVDVHMMVERPERHTGEIAKAGADGITIHAEATPHLHYALQAIRDAGATAGAALNPATPADALTEIADDALDLALCMSVNPGWGGQSFIPHSERKLQRLRALLPERVALEVDGGVHDATIGTCVRAGANLLVTGSGVFGSPDPVASYLRLAQVAGEGAAARPTAGPRS
jgi:ribulose-phosphate 3-epimerase